MGCGGWSVTSPGSSPGSLLSQWPHAREGIIWSRSAGVAPVSPRLWAEALCPGHSARLSPLGLQARPPQGPDPFGDRGRSDIVTDCCWLRPRRIRTWWTWVACAGGFSPSHWWRWLWESWGCHQRYRKQTGWNPRRGADLHSALVHGAVEEPFS